MSYEIETSFADFDETNTTVEVVCGEWKIYVQTTDGRYMPQLHCIIMDDEDGEVSSRLFDEDEDLYDAMIKAAEQFMREQEEENIELLNAGFNCSIANQSVYIKHDKEKKCYTIIIKNDDYTPNSYTSRFGAESGKFETLDEVNAYLDQFRTSEHYDMQGLSALIFELRHSELKRFELKQNQY